ncbi:MAG: ArnT family glycosyltransferase [Solirubrobacteraceae bacterium]
MTRGLVRFTQLRRPKFVLVCALILAVEAAAILLFSVEGRHHVLGGIDGVNYEAYARNLADHGSFSSATAPPYSGSVFRTPGYPALLAVLHLFGGKSLLLVRAAQFALVGLTGLLVYFIASAVSSEAVARVATLLSISYLPLLWYAREHLSDVLATVLAAAIVWSVLWATRTDGRTSLGRFALVGVLAGLAGLVRPELAPVVIVIAAGVILWPGRLTRRTAAKGSAVMGVAFLVSLLPWTIRNYELTHRVLPFGTASGTSLYASALQWNGTISMAFTVPDFRRDIAATDAILAPVIATDAARHVSTSRTEIDENSALTGAARREAGRLGLVGVVGRLPQRLAYLWSVGDEPPVGAYALWHNIDRVQYYVLFVLVLIGLVVALRDAERRSRFWPLLAFAVLATAVHLVFHVQARYTLPARPLLLIFAGAGLVWIFNRVGGSERPTANRRAK